MRQLLPGFSWRGLKRADLSKERRLVILKRKNPSTDEELAEQIKNGSTQASAELYDRYRIYSWQISHEQYALNPHNGIALDDYFAVAFSAVATAVKKYNVGKGKALYPYWKAIALHDICELYEAQSYSRGARAFAGISLDEADDEESLLNEERYGFEEPHQTASGLYDEMFAIIFDIKNKFTPREQQILMCLLDGYSQEEIIEILGIKRSTFNYHLRSGSEKLRKLLGR